MATDGCLSADIRLDEMQKSGMHQAVEKRARTGSSSSDPLARQAAEQRLAENPFFVSESDIALLHPEVVFCLSSREYGLRVHIKYGSKAKKYLEQISGVHYLKSEKSYFFPVGALNPLLAVLRDRKISFAVEEKTGKRLAETAVLRAGLLERPNTGTGQQLRACLLVPYLEQLCDSYGTVGESREVKFCLRGYTTSQLRDCFPQISSYAAKKQCAAGMSERELLQLLYHVQQSTTQVWMTNEVHAYLSSRAPSFGKAIEESAECFDDELLAVAMPALCWACDAENRGGLLVERSVYEKIVERSEGNLFEGISPARFSCQEQSLFLPVRDSKLLEFQSAAESFLASNGYSQPVRSRRFAGLHADLLRRRELLQRQMHFQEMKDNALPEVDPQLAERLFPHQRVAVSWLLENPRAFLGDDMGLGKTLSVLAGFKTLHSQGALDFLLVVCPNSLARNWQREAETWIAGTKLVRLPATKGKRTTFLHKLEKLEPDWIPGLVVNYETFRLDDVFPVLQSVCRTRRTMLCVDESQRTKNSRSKIFSALTQVAPLCERRVLLSGTPTPKDVSDIWAQILLLDDGTRFGGNYYRWLERVAELGTKWSEFEVKRYRPEAVEETILRVRELLLRRRKEEVVDLPEKIFSVRDVVLHGDQKKRYEEVRKDLLLRITTATGETYIREIDNILEEFLRAVQVSSNPRLVDENWKGEPAKFLELDEIVDEIVREQEGKLVVWTNYRRNVAELVERYAELGAAGFSGETPTAERERLIQEFQSDKRSSIRILVAIPAAGGVGITLTRAQTAVYLDKTWNAEHWLQSVDRIHRIGQTGTVNIISLHGCLVDDIIYKNLKKKQRMQARLLGDGRHVDEPLHPSRQELLGAVERRE